MLQFKILTLSHLWLYGHLDLRPFQTSGPLDQMEDPQASEKKFRNVDKPIC